jgi:hypothetical protein
VNTDWQTLITLSQNKLDKYDRKCNGNQYQITHWVNYWIRYGDCAASRKILNHFCDTERIVLTTVTYFYDRIYEPTTKNVVIHNLRKQVR